MCGIVGIVDLEGRPVELAELQAMNDVIRHRGPDDEGYYVDEGVGLGMRRLSIIDLETGDQPIGNEDGSIQVVLNGEIYNFAELRRDLEARGHVFRTRADTETIVHLYEEMGPDCVRRLRGMFAFALWDGRQRQLLLARDRMGIKPLYCGVVGRRLVFASELKALLQLPEVERRLDWQALDHLLTFLVTPADRSIIDGIRKLEPAHLLTAGPGRPPRTRRYWELRFRPDRDRDEDELVEELGARLSDAVESHMVSDVPVGAFLSGGVDSSAVVAAMSRLSSEPIKTYSIGFPESDYSELDEARLVARRFGTDHHERVLEVDVAEILQDLAWHLDEPFGDSSAIPTYMVAELAAEDVTVVLSGDGGDEIFAGYDRYVTESRERRARWLPAVARRLLAATAGRLPDGMRGRNWLRHMSLPGARRYLDANRLLQADVRGGLLRPEAREMLGDAHAFDDAVDRLRSRSGHWLSQLQAHDIDGYLPLDILTKVDRTTMAHSIEARVPLLDHRLVEFAATIPPEMLMRRGETKRIFKRALRGDVPDAVLDKPKKGFAIPLGRWFRGPLEPLLKDVLLSERSRQRGIFEPRAVDALIRRNEAGAPLDLQLWTLLSFELWCRAFLDAPPAATGIGTSRRRTPVRVLSPGREPRRMEA